MPIAVRSRLYQQALAELRERHRDEFDEIYEGLREAEGFGGPTAAEIIREQVVQLIAEMEPTRQELIDAFSDVVPAYRIDHYLRDLREAGLITTPGSGYSGGRYRLVEQ